MTTPERLGPYRIVRRLGAGGMGEVFEALHEELNRPVALKLLHHAAVQGDEAQRRFRREMQTAAALVHPNLVRVFDGGALDGTLYMAMELVTGESLAARLARERPSTSWSVKVARQVADGLAFLHGQGILHRDVKPHNILLERDGTAKLADFGLVRTQEGTAITAEGGLVGTLAYMAPELVSGQQATIASDLWGLGCVLYEMLAGNKPFQGGATELFRAIKQEPPPPIDGLPPALEQLLARLLDKKPEARPGSAAEVSSALTARASTAIRVPRRPSSATLVRQPAAPRRWPLALALALVTIPAGALVFRPRAPEPAPSVSAMPTTGPGTLAWYTDVMKRLKGLEERDPRQRDAVVFDALQEMGRAAPMVPWPGALDPVVTQVIQRLPPRFQELRARGKNAYEDATLELAGDVPRRERAYAAEFRMLIRDLSAVLPCAMRRDAPHYLISQAGAAVDYATGTEFRVFDAKTVLAFEQEVLALCAANPTWRGPYMRSWVRGRSSGPNPVWDRRAALENLERELETRTPREEDCAIWHDLVAVTMQTCALTKDRAAGQELYAHAVARRKLYSAFPATKQQWRAVELIYRSLMK